MKKIIRYSIATVVFAVMALTTISCEKFLDQAPSSEQDKEYIFQDYLRAQRYLDMMYYYMPRIQANYKFDEYYGFLESATDMSEYTASYGATNRSFNVGNWKATAAATEVSDVWYRCYKQIRRAWMFLDNVDNFNNEPTGRKPLMKGECHFMVAYFYFELAKRYGGVPLVKRVLDLESDYKIPRSSFDETIAFIMSELDTAEALLPDWWSDEGSWEDYGRATKTWCKALRSRVTLLVASPLHNPTGDASKWKAAAEAAKDCLDYCEAQGFHVLTTDWQNLFLRKTPSQNPELIVFKRAGTYATNFNTRMINYEQATPGDMFWGYGSNSPTQNFVDRFPVITYNELGVATGVEDFDWNNPDHVANIYKNRDPRFYYTVLYNGRMWINRAIETWRDGTTYGADRDPKNHLYSRTGYYLRKYWGRECKNKNNPGGCKTYPFYIRLAEMYFNYAEAMNEVYGPDNGNGGMSAIEAINTVRARLICPPNNQIQNNQSDPYYYVLVERTENPDFPVLPQGLPGLPTGMSKEQARDKIQNERIIEFAFEDQYFYDILRWKRGPELIGGAIYGVDIVKSGSTYSYNRIKVEDRIFDAGRMYLYPIPQDEVYNLGIEQNPGW